jgi:hypothetical protein
MPQQTFVFKLHFNRINMQRGDPRVWTVRFRGVCHQCIGVSLLIPAITTYDPAGRQPRALVRGYARKVVITQGWAVVT